MTDYGQIKALAFDHQGTLFDKHAVAPVVEEAFPGRGEDIARAWFETTKQYYWLSTLMGRALPWDELTRRALEYVVEARGLALDEALHARLGEADRALPPFAEVPAALARLAGRFDLWVLSGADAAMIEDSQRNAGIDGLFTGIISLGSHGVFKPGPAAYAVGVSQTGLPKQHIGFVSANSYDVMGSLNYGYTTFWINRGGGILDRLGLEPDLEVADLAALADALGA